MAMPNESTMSIRLYVTHVDGYDHFLKLSGQLDKQAAMMIESLFQQARENLEKGVGAVPASAIHEGVICAAKYKDGTYYRAKVVNTSHISTGLVGVHFIDYGNREIISLSTIRFLDSYDSMFLQLRGQATEYYLSRLIHPAGRWEDLLLQKLQTLLCYNEYLATIESHAPIPLISIKFKGQDLANHLAANRFGVAIALPQQEVLLMNENPNASKWTPKYVNEQQTFPDHVPFLLNQNFPSNPASAMRLQQSSALAFNGAVPAVPSQISQRLLINKTAAQQGTRNTVNLKAPARLPQVAPNTHTVPPIPATGLLMKAPGATSPKKYSTYKSRLLETNTHHKVFVSYAEEGPELFAVQVATDCNRLQDMMDEINRRPHSSLAEPPMIGTVCLGRMSVDRVICRGIVMNLSGSQCKLFFVDFGDTEMVSYYDIFDIPEEFVKPNVFAMRFCLSGVKKLEKGPHLNERFKQLVNGKILNLKVVPPEGPPLIQYGELYVDNKNVCELLMASTQDELQFKWMEMLPLGTKQSVLVSYVDSCIKFYVQLSDKIDKLTAVMKAVKIHCENTNSPGELPVGASCCAQFPDDRNWYRARIRETKGRRVVVAYVDYGNEQEIDVSDLRTITAELIKLPAQALKCALKGFENRPVKSETSNQLEMLALEKTLMANIVGTLSNDTMLVTLVDDTVTPPLDVAKKMAQYSQPRSSHEPKTPTRKDAPESFSSPEESQPEDARKSFRREKSFKEERTSRPSREENPDFQRGGSFKSRDNKESFDRSGPGRHSEKFGGRPDRGDRNERPDRRGPKPWENSQTSPTQAVVDREESLPNYQPPKREFNRDRENVRDRDNRDNNRENRDNYRDRRKPRSEPLDKSAPRQNWKKDGGGAGKRLRQAAEESSADTQTVHAQRASVQDRLKRDRFNQPEEREERKNEEWGNRNRDNRPPREINRGERREWGEKKDWGQKRDFRENRGGGERSERPERTERGDRPARSNFSPRDRAEKSFGSEKSFKSQDSGGRAAPAKPRPKPAHAHKELPEPVPLDTPFAEPSVELGAQHEVSVTWIVSPESFYTQILSLQPQFLEMMHRIPALYKGVRPLAGAAAAGAAVLARYPADGVLYRARVLSAQPFSKYIVRYVDFGNKQLVDAHDLWPLDRSLLELPAMAIPCALLGVAPKDGEWKADAEIDLCFNAPRYQCSFQECADDVYKVSLWNNGVSVADTLVQKQLALLSEHQSPATLKDEPIDMTIIAGQQIMCRVTHVESFEKFYVQLDIKKADLVETTIANFDIAKLTPPSPESIVEGTHCTVLHDGNIYRAILQDVTDHTDIKVVLPDYGNTITTSVDKLMILPSELSVYYYQSLHACFNNYNSDSVNLMSLEKLKARLTNHKFIVYINDVDGITLVTTLYDKNTGRKVAIFEPDSGAYEEVSPLCARAVFNYNYGVACLAHAKSLDEIYLHRTADALDLRAMLDNLFKFYERGAGEPLTSFEEGTLCAGRATDGNWHRATLVGVDGDRATVHFADYGYSETLAKDSLRKLEDRFVEPCAFALAVGLGLLPLRDTVLDAITSWCTTREVQVTLGFGADGWLASLHHDGVDLAMRLIADKLAEPRAPPAEPRDEPEPPPAEPAEAPLPAGCAQAYISHIDTPGQFWLQMADSVDRIEEIQATLQAAADAYPELASRETGALCAARYLADEQWYRAEILDADADITTVRFVDYGNTDVLDNRPGLLREIPRELAALERGGVRASLDAVPSGTGEWSEAASDAFARLVPDLAAPVAAQVVLRDVTTYVHIYAAGRNLADELVAAGHAARPDAAPCGGLPACFASHVNSPSEFWLQLESATADLQAMEEALEGAESFPRLEARAEGLVCAARYPEDGAWYRAQVVVDGSEGTEVLFMDYGNASIADELRSLPADLELKPALSRKCALQKPRDVKTWSRRSEVKFNELAAEGATVFNVQFIASGDISIVELFLEGRSVTEELVGLCEEQVPAPERPAPVGQDLRAAAKICYVRSAHELYVNLESAAAALERVTEALGAAPDLDCVAELKVGALCAAFWPEDAQWYRARILEFCDAGYHVLFVDYGNRAKCEEFRKLPEEFASLEPLAKCCRLAGVPEDEIFQENCRSKLDELALEDVTLQIEFLDSSSEPMLVKIMVDDKDVLSLISSERLVPDDDVVKELETEVESEKPSAENIVRKESEIKVPDVPSPDEDKTDETTSERTQELIATEGCKVEATVKTDDETDTLVESLVADSTFDTEVEKLETVVKSNIPENIENQTLATKIDDEVFEKALVADNEKEDFVDAEEMNASNDLNESLESNHTVIENTSFDANSLSADSPLESDKNKTLEKDISDTLESSNDTIKTPEREESKESITDTGYTSEDKSFDKESPTAVKTESASIDSKFDDTLSYDGVDAKVETSEMAEKDTIEIPTVKESAKSKEDLSAKVFNTEKGKEHPATDLNKTI